MKNSILKLKLPIPYSFFEVRSYYKKTKPLTETEALIIILIATAQKSEKEIKATDNFSSLFKKKYNIEDKFLDFFEKDFNSLVSNKVIINKFPEVKFDKILVGNLEINRTISEFLDNEKFLGLEKETINKKYFFHSDLLSNNYSLKEDNSKKITLPLNNNIEILIKENSKLNKNYDSEIENILLKKNPEMGLVKKEITDYYGEEISINNMNNISFIEEIIEFKLDENRIFSTESKGEKILTFFKEKSYYHNDFINLIEESLKEKIQPNEIKYSNDSSSFKSFNLEEIGLKNIYELKDEKKFFHLVDNSELFEIFRNKKNFKVIIDKEYEIEYFELVTKKSDDIELFLKVINNNTLFNKLKIEKQNDILKKIIKDFNLLITNEWIIKDNIKEIIEIIYNEIPTNFLFKKIKEEQSFFEKNKSLIKNLFIFDSEKDKKYSDFFKNSSFISLIGEHNLIKFYNFDYEQGISYFNNSLIEEQIISFWKEYKNSNSDLILLEKLDKNIQLFSTKNSELKDFMRNLKNKILIEIKISKEEIKKEVSDLAVKTRELFEPLWKPENIKLEIFLEKYYESNKAKKEDIRNKWNANSGFLHHNNDINYNTFTLEKAITINKFFTEISKEIIKIKGNKK